MLPSLLECAADGFDITAGTGCTTGNADAEIECCTVGSSLIAKHDVHTFLHFLGGILPDRRRVVGVVRDLDLERGIIRDAARHLKDGNGNVAVHGQRGGQRHGGAGNALGERSAQADAFLAVVRGDLDGVAAVEDALEIFGGTACPKVSAVPLATPVRIAVVFPVQLFGDSQSVAVCIGNGVAEIEGCVLLPQIRGAGVDGRGVLVLTVPSSETTSSEGSTKAGRTP